MPPPGGGGGQGDQNQGLDLIWGVAFIVIVILALMVFCSRPHLTRHFLLLNYLKSKSSVFLLIR